MGLDSTILEILGDGPSVVKQYGKDIQADLTVRLQHIAMNGLTKETRKESRKMLASQQLHSD